MANIGTAIADITSVIGILLAASVAATTTAQGVMVTKAVIAKNLTSPQEAISLFARSSSEFINSIYHYLLTISKTASTV